VGARECLPSSREPASRNPQTECTRTVTGNDMPSRTGSPSLCSCPASGGASSFLPASALRTTEEPFDPPASKTRDASDRLLPPVRLRLPAPRAFPARFRSLRCVETPQSLGSARLGPEDKSVSRRSRPLRRIDNRTRTSCRSCRSRPSVGVILPTVLVATEPLTSLSPLPLPSKRWTRLRAYLWLVRKPPRSS